jgi:hypothetical protein
MFVVDLIFKFVEVICRAVWRSVNVKRSAPEKKHATVEFIDAFLFRHDDRNLPK